jgi:streptogramin lyase
MFSLLRRENPTTKTKRRKASPRRPYLEVLEDRCLLSGGITELPGPVTPSEPIGITIGPDGNLWFTDFVNVPQNASNIWRLTTSGDFTRFPLPPDAYPYGIVTGPDNQLWFIESGQGEYQNDIAQMGTDGQVTKRCQVPGTRSNLSWITVGPDNNLWFTQDQHYAIGQMSLDCGFSEHLHHQPGRAYGITAGPDGQLWFTTYGTGAESKRVASMTTGGDITGFHTIPSNHPDDPLGPLGIVPGPDGNLWFAEASDNKIGRISPSLDDLDLFSSPTDGSVPGAITLGPDGNLWFTERAGNKIGRVTPEGIFSEFTVPTDNSFPSDITSGPDSNIWFTEALTGKIGQLHVLTASGLNLGDAVKAGQTLDAEVANFHDDQPGMLGSNYQVDINWGDGSSTGQAWAAGGGNWVATGSHIYADPGHYDITVTITDRTDSRMSATAFSTVDVSGPSTSGLSHHRGVTAVLLSTPASETLAGPALADSSVLPTAPAEEAAVVMGLHEASDGNVKATVFSSITPPPVPHAVVDSWESSEWLHPDVLDLLAQNLLG